MGFGNDEKGSGQGTQKGTRPEKDEEDENDSTSTGDSDSEEEEEEEEQEKWRKHCSSKQRILLVGEGEFSFSLSLARTLGSARNMIVTSLDTLEKIEKKYGNGIKNVMELEERGCLMFCQVDAKQMSHYFFLKTQRFNRIVYNFPHVGFFYPEDSCCQIQ